MKKIKQKSKGKRASFILGLPFTLLALVGGLNLIVSGIDNLTYSSINTHDEAIAMIVGGACVVVLGISHFRSGVFMRDYLGSRSGRRLYSSYSRSRWNN